MRPDDEVTAPTCGVCGVAVHVYVCGGWCVGLLYVCVCVCVGGGGGGGGCCTCVGVAVHVCGGWCVGLLYMCVGGGGGV